MSWPAWLWGRPGRVLATLGLTILVGWRPDQLWIWILIFTLVGFIIVHETVNWRREQRLASLLYQNYPVIQNRALRLIADLANLTAKGFDLWMLDLYLPPNTGALFACSRNVYKLDRSLSVSLTDVRPVPLEIRLDHQLFGPCFEGRTKLWWGTDLAESSSANSWHEMNEAINVELRKTYGVISINPVVDRLGRDCLGLLVVHAKPDPEIVTKVLGALKESEGQRRLVEACQDIHNQMRMGSSRNS